MNLPALYLLRAMKQGSLWLQLASLLYIGLLIFADWVLLLFTAVHTGPILALAIHLSSSLAGLLLFGGSFHRHAQRAGRSAAAGNYPRREFIHLAVLLPCLILGVLPGWGSFLLGFLIFLPPVRQFLGRRIHRHHEQQFVELYAILRTEEE